MKSAKDLNYRLHHLCIYDDKPRENMWPYLRWHHGITNYFSGAVFHVTGEGHSDYTFLGCGGRAYQIQIEAPPFQFEYERNWWADHGRGYNHICWITSDARASMEQLLANGATEVMPFEEFPTYDGFVVHDPEGRWVEIMEYTDDTFRVQEFTNAPSGECGLQMVGNALHGLPRGRNDTASWLRRNPLLGHLVAKRDPKRDAERHWNTAEMGWNLALFLLETHDGGSR